MTAGWTIAAVVSIGVTVIAAHEDALAAEFGVTRPALRAGLAELRATDAVTVIAGRGAFVRDPELTALCRERDVAWDTAKREADRAKEAEDRVRRVPALAGKLEAEGQSPTPPLASVAP
ncbi:GntR family transcriptional regulator [Streptomyces sp. NPDC052051]|uniref:GntR family transcriptional regulator n=1 Tax=Streptomyces sp. NPDC052051 TaxID=3154649 RepID=UPI0034389218